MANAAKGKTRIAKNSDATPQMAVLGDGGKYPLVSLKSINVVERPKGETDSKLFFNPREEGSFTEESIGKLRDSIRKVGLQQPPIVRVEVDGDKITSTELIAGERRIRSLRSIVENKLPCYDEDSRQPAVYKKGDVVLWTIHFGRVISHKNGVVKIDLYEDALGEHDCPEVEVHPTTPGDELYSFVPCKVVHNCDDQRALKLAFIENKESEPLTVQEEINLVSRLTKRGLKQDDIARLLGSNVTWVSQTGNFESELPKGAYQKLIDGTMARNVAVAILSYRPEDRQRIFEASLQVAKEETTKAIVTHREEKEKLEDEQDLLLDEAKQAEKKGDATKAARAARKAGIAASRAKKAAERQARAEEESGKLKQGHLKAGATKVGAQTKKVRALERDEIVSLYIVPLEKCLGDKVVDEVSGQVIPDQYIALVLATAQAIVLGNREPFSIIRNQMVEEGAWEAVEEKSSSTIEDYTTEDDEFEPVVSDDVDDDDDDVDDDDDEVDDEIANRRETLRGRDKYDQEWN